jgi:hypothetical protein
VLQRLAHRRRQLLRELLSREHRRRLKGFELAARFRADGQHLFEVQLRIHEHIERRRGRLCDPDFGPPRRVALRTYRHVVLTGRQVLENESAVGTRDHLPAQLLEDDGGARDRLTGERVQQPPGKRYAGLRVRPGTHQDEDGSGARSQERT